MDLCGQCRRRLDAGTHRLRMVKPKCFELSEVTGDGEIKVEKFLAMGYVPSNPSDSVAGRTVTYNIGLS